ncbi:MAG: maltooligosyl trehalose synthase [Candidatus Tectimicrobiota bacterium]|nr:MAG: maltooligosyl trehalose synthase [Candidatus Tectomicrobia bacterium]
MAEQADEQQWQALSAALARQRRVPVATYRLQLHAAFPFAQARRLVPYLHALGISDCYTSPYLKARPGSPHGYDIVDYGALNPELGTPEDYDAFVEALQQHGMGHLLDFVPNHMGVLEADNPWWQDVLAHGPASRYARFFDIDWEPPTPGLRHKVLLPILGAPYGQVLENQELQLAYGEGQFFVHYYTHRLPLAPCTTPQLLRPCLAALEAQLGPSHAHTEELRAILAVLQQLPARTETAPSRVAQRYRQTAAAQQRLARLEAQCPALQAALAQTLQAFGGVKGEPRSFDALHGLLEAQAYRLCYWRVAADELNYRRFFDIAHLAAVRVEDPEVFAAMHAFVLELLAAGKVTGLRIDHIDGLYDPQDYLQRLQAAYVARWGQGWLAARGEAAALEALVARFAATCRQQPRNPAARPLYVVVEKILDAEESLPESWPVEGTTGYDALNELNALFVDATQAEALRALYLEFTGSRQPFADLLYEAKRLVLQTTLAAELEALGWQLARLVAGQRRWRDVSRRALTAALREVVACFPVYRTYVREEDDALSDADAAVLTAALAAARQRCPALHEAFDVLAEVLLQRAPEESSTRQAQRRFVCRLQQLTGPAMAKGFEDTALYRYTPLASLDEVGGHPDRFGLAVAEAHRRHGERQRRWPATLVATSTHDTKRSEDVRARLNVLSELVAEWREALWRWHRLNQPHRVLVAGRSVPSRQEEYLLYQTLLGAWPLEPLTPEARIAFQERIQAYMVKALREAKVHTSWLHVDQAYEAAVVQFIDAVLDEARGADFLADFGRFQARVAAYGMWNALAQTLLKLTVPGVPDLYQGCELWDFSLVDPDNRRPVDYARREQFLAELQRRWQAPPARLPLVAELLQQPHDGRLKLFLIWRTLRFRRQQAALFLDGDYLPLAATGSRQEHVFAFARSAAAAAAVVVVPRLVARLQPTATAAPLGEAVWGDTAVVLPPSLAGHPYRHLLTGETVVPQRHRGQEVLRLAEVCRTFPVALLQRLVP